MGKKSKKSKKPKLEVVKIPKMFTISDLPKPKKQGKYSTLTFAEKQRMHAARSMRSIMIDDAIDAQHAGWDRGMNEGDESGIDGYFGIGPRSTLSLEMVEKKKDYYEKHKDDLERVEKAVSKTSSEIARLRKQRRALTAKRDKKRFGKSIITKEEKEKLKALNTDIRNLVKAHGKVSDQYYSKRKRLTLLKEAIGGKRISSPWD